MGGVIGKQMSSIMEDNLKKNQKFMLETQQKQVGLYKSLIIDLVLC